MKNYFCSPFLISLFVYASAFGQKTVSSNSDWINKEKTILIQDGFGNIIERETQNWNDELGSWENSRKYLYYFNSENREIEVIINQFNKTLNKYEKKGHRINEFQNIDGNSIKKVVYSWNNNKNDFRPKNKHLIRFLDENKKTESEHITQVWSKNNNDWINKRKYIYFYTDDNILEQRIIQFWNREKMSWLNHLSYVHQKSKNGLEISVVSKKWDDSDQAWVNVDRHTQVSNIQKTATMKQIKSEWSKTQSKWVNLKKVENTIYQKNAEYSTSKSWLPTTSSWENDDRKTHYIYNPNGGIAEIVFQEWDNQASKFENRYRTVFERDRNGILLSETKQNAKKLHRDKNLDQINITCRVANPYPIGSEIKFNNLKDNAIYSVQLIDINGIIIFNSENVKSSFRINERFFAGTYFLTLFENNKNVHIEKIVFPEF